MARMTPVRMPIDEDRHAAGDGPWWCESFWFGFWASDATTGWHGGLCELTLLPNQSRSWYRAVLVRDGEPALVIEDLDAPLPRQQLELKSHGLWADHVCEVPAEQWTVANEAYAVAFDDPDEAIGRGFGVPTAMAFDLEWYATGPIVARSDGDSIHHGYRQPGEVHGVIELPAGPLEFEAPAARWHHWGPMTLPAVDEANGGARRLARVPWRVPSPFDAIVDDVLTTSGWLRKVLLPGG